MARTQVVGSEQRLVMIIGLTFFGIAILGPAILRLVSVAGSLILGTSRCMVVVAWWWWWYAAAVVDGLLQ